jgi:hypothetical protein
VKEIVFLVGKTPEGGYAARAVGASIFTEGDDVSSLEENIRDAIRCHFDVQAVILKRVDAEGSQTTQTFVF